MEVNKEKMKQVIHYIIQKCQEKTNFGITVLYKLIYFSDFNHYELYETSITNEIYIKRKLGPVPSNFDGLYDELTRENKVSCEKELVIDYKRNKYISLKEPDISLLNNKEIEVIDSVIEKLSHMTGKEISDYSHDDKPWRVAKFQDPLDPEFVFYRDDEYSVREYTE